MRTQWLSGSDVGVRVVGGLTNMRFRALDSQGARIRHRQRDRPVSEHRNAAGTQSALVLLTSPILFVPSLLEMSVIVLVPPSGCLSLPWPPRSLSPRVGNSQTSLHLVSLVSALGCVLGVYLASSPSPGRPFLQIFPSSSCLWAHG